MPGAGVANPLLSGGLIELLLGYGVIPGVIMSISGLPERRMGRAGHRGRSQP
jgi:hypothetical protein